MAPRKTPIKAALASWIGSVLEYYDFFIYGTAAALVFGKVFFPDSDPATATLLSFATYGVGYVARPIGAFFMGHLGDRYGRKRVLMLTVIADGRWRPSSSAACRPTTTSASGRRSCSSRCGCCRASPRPASSRARNSLTLEHAPDDRRAFFTSFTLTGTQAGLVIATAVLAADRRAAGGPAADLGLADPVLAERHRRRRRPAHPPPARGDARVRGGGRRDASPSASRSPSCCATTGPASCA